MITWDLPKKGCEKRFGYVNFDMFLRAKYSDWKVLGCKQGYESMIIYDGPPKWWSDSAQKIVQIWFKYYWYGFISKNTSMVLRLVKVVTQLLIKELRKKGRHDYLLSFPIFPLAFSETHSTIHTPTVTKCQSNAHVCSECISEIPVSVARDIGKRTAWTLRGRIYGLNDRYYQDLTDTIKTRFFIQLFHLNQLASVCILYCECHKWSYWFNQEGCIYCKQFFWIIPRRRF